MRPFPTPYQVRLFLGDTADAQGASLAFLSRQIGRSSGYLGRFVREGRPEWLSAEDREYLARYLNVDTFELGDRDKAKPDR